MRQPNLDKVEIVEPPLGEFAKKQPRWLKRACLTSCFSVVLFLILGALAIRLFVGPGPKVLDAVPPGFPRDIPLYDRDAIERITFISGKYKNRGLEIAAFFPKVILSPLFLALNREAGGETPPTMIERQAQVVRRLWKLIATPVGDHRDTVHIEWAKLRAEPNFVIAYYQDELRKKKYTIEVESEGEGVKQFSFSGKNGASGSLFVRAANPPQRGTEYAVLTVNLPPTER